MQPIQNQKPHRLKQQTTPPHCPQSGRGRQLVFCRASPEALPEGSCPERKKMVPGLDFRGEAWLNEVRKANEKFSEL
jgi:hypothetical protein